MIAEYDGANLLLRRHVHGPNMDEPLIQYEGSGTTNYGDNNRITLMQRATAGIAFKADFTFDPIGRLSSLANDAPGTVHDLTIDQGFNPASQTRRNDAYSWTGAVAVNRPYTANGLN